MMDVVRWKHLGLLSDSEKWDNQAKMIRKTAKDIAEMNEEISI